MASSQALPPGPAASHADCKVEPQIPCQHHGAHDRHREGDTQPACRRRLQTVEGDEGEHQHDEAREKMILAAMKTGFCEVSRFWRWSKVHITVWAMRKSDPAAMDSQPACRTKGPTVAAGADS